MEPFTILTGIAAPLRLDNIDTDMICPSTFMKTVTRDGLGRHLFHDMRHDAAGKPLPDFVLNRSAYQRASILVAGRNFGCGSSREHAVWAIREFGFRCIIAESYADIFATNATRNGILLITLTADLVDVLSNDAEKGANARVTVDLRSQTITRPDGSIIKFEIDPFRRHCLLNGLGQTEFLEKRRTKIQTFEARHRQVQPWLSRRP